MNLELNINVNIGLKPDTAALLAALLSCKPTAPTAPEPREPEQTPEQTPRPEAREPEAREPEEAVTPTVPAGPRDFGVEIREIMHRTRQRVEGEDYKENTDGEGYKRYHRALTGEFKAIAGLLQAEKPSAIDTAEKVDKFKQMCDELYITEDGKLETKQAPF